MKKPSQVRRKNANGTKPQECRTAEDLSKKILKAWGEAGPEERLVILDGLLLSLDVMENQTPRLFESVPRKSPVEYLN